MKRVIIDTSSLILMHKCGTALKLLEFCTPVIPETVFAELTVPGHDGAEFFHELGVSGMIIICNPAKIEMQSLTGNLHPGERDVIKLYYENMGDYIIIDDRKGGAFCRDNSIPYINALLSVKILFLRHLLSEDEYMFAWNRLVKNGRYSGRIISWVEKAGEEILSEFM